MKLFIRIAFLFRSNPEALSAKNTTSNSAFQNNSIPVSPAINKDDNPYEVVADNVANNHDISAENKNDNNSYDISVALPEEKSQNYKQDNPIHLYDYPPEENVFVT